MGGSSTKDGALGAFVNPAAWGMSGSADLAFWWNDETIEERSLDNFGLSLGGPLGISTQRFTRRVPEGRLRVQETQIGFSAGDRGSRWGAAWRWAGGDNEQEKRESGIVTGGILRPTKMLSFGISTFWSTESGKRGAVADIGVRPFGIPQVAFFGDYSLESDERPSDGIWSVGVTTRPISGLHVGARVLEDTDEDGLSFVLQAGVFSGGLGAETLSQVDHEGDLGATTMVLRMNAPIRPLRSPWRKSQRFVMLDLQNKEISHQQDLWFDKRRIAWIDLLRRFEEIEKDPEIAGVALNLSGTQCRPSFVWEFRERLMRLRKSGREVHVHFDRAGMSAYYLASAADRITMDRAGTLALPGFALHRTYFRSLMDKLGLGIEEFRYFRYKSAFESLSRVNMSDEDREQYGRFVDVVYEIHRDGMAEGRDWTASQLDDVIEHESALTAPQAKELGLIDEITRWHELEDSLEERGRTLEHGVMRSRDFLEERWGRPSKILLVYADGECAMDQGLDARELSQYLLDVAEDSEIKAIVVRVDSPGGDPHAADIVADAMAACRRSGKPIIVSQGDLAASGGYYISLESDRVLTTPLTLTGAIGVIAIWIWDAGFSEKSGLTADGVQRGSHADLFAGIRFPVLEARLPLRPFNDEEHERTRETLLEIYDEFVSKVAEARGRSEAEIEEVAQGRVWSGEDAIERGLCDELGGLADAIREAKARIGIEGDEETLLEEYPPRRRFRLPKHVSPLPGIRSRAESPAQDYPFRFLELIGKNPGAPLLLLPPEAVLPDWDAASSR
jgi:protease-4